MLFLMFYVCLAKYWGDGPNWPQGGFEVDDCKDTWWKNLLYVNNIVDQDKQVQMSRFTRKLFSFFFCFESGV